MMWGITGRRQTRPQNLIQPYHRFPRSSDRPQSRDRLGRPPDSCALHPLEVGSTPKGLWVEVSFPGNGWWLQPSDQSRMLRRDHGPSGSVTGRFFFGKVLCLDLGFRPAPNISAGSSLRIYSAPDFPPEPMDRGPYHKTA